MKYNEKLFNMSADAYELMDSSNNVEEDEEVLKLQNELLKALFIKFEECLKSDEGRNGILKVYLVDHWRCACDNGFYEISKLINSGNFNSFASDYCIYLGEVKKRTQLFETQYYEVIWDYKIYFEILKEKSKNTKPLIQKTQKFPLDTEGPILRKVKRRTGICGRENE